MTGTVTHHLCWSEVRTQVWGGLIPRNLWKRSCARSQCTPWIRTMAVVGDNSRSNTKTGDKGAESCQRIRFTSSGTGFYTWWVFASGLSGHLHPFGPRKFIQKILIRTSLHLGIFSPGERDGWESAFSLPLIVFRRISVPSILAFPSGVESKRAPCFSSGRWLNLPKSSVKGNCGLSCVSPASQKQGQGQGRADGYPKILASLLNKAWVFLIGKDRYIVLSDNALPVNNELTTSRQGIGLTQNLMQKAFEVSQKGDSSNSSSFS